MWYNIAETSYMSQQVFTPPRAEHPLSIPVWAGSQSIL
jgi:hypothetical protein